MPLIHTKLPANVQGHYAEYQLGRKLEALKDDKLELWFDVNYIPNIGDCDVMIFHPNLGIYLAEVKGMKLEDIEIYDLTRFELKRGNKRQHPVGQIKDVQIRTKNYLEMFNKKERNAIRPPFLQTTVIWPNIKRSEWLKRFDSAQIVIQAQCMVFEDDLVSVRSFTARLESFWELPLLGVRPPSGTRRGEHGNMVKFREAIAPTQDYEDKNDSLSDELRRSVFDSKEIADKYKPPTTFNVSFEGAPGTGKSTILREIGLLHAMGGGNVLHVCFNKVLAADQRREYKLLMKKELQYGNIDVFDEYELYKSIHTNWEPSRSEGGFKEREEHVSEIIALMGTPEGFPGERYDTILVDEAQDLSEALFQLLEKLARPKASWFISYGKGQEIFSFNKENPAPWLRSWLETAERRVLRRSFRNSTRAFLMAQNFWENYPNISKSEEWFANKLQLSSNTQDAWELDLSLPRDTNDFKVVRLAGGDARRNSIKDLILSAIEDARDANRGMDLLIAVGSEIKFEGKTDIQFGSSHTLVIEILKELSKTIEIDILDLVPRDNRRSTPQAGTIRIARYQNIRGISASHVILLDLENLETWANQIDERNRGPLQNYGYIALSRSRASTIVAINQDSNSSIEKFIETSLTMVRQKFLEASKK